MYFLSQDEQEFFAALCETIVPAGTDERKDPGALTVGALSYIDSSLNDFPRPSQEYFRGAIKTVEDKCAKEFSKKFVELKIPERDRVLKVLFMNPKTRESVFD